MKLLFFNIISLSFIIDNADMKIAIIVESITNTLIGKFIKSAINNNIQENGLPAFKNIFIAYSLYPRLAIAYVSTA